MRILRQGAVDDAWERETLVAVLRAEPVTAKSDARVFVPRGSLGRLAASE